MYKIKIAEKFNDGFYIVQAKAQPPPKKKNRIDNKFNTDNAN